MPHYVIDKASVLIDREVRMSSDPGITNFAIGTLGPFPSYQNNLPLLTDLEQRYPRCLPAAWAFFPGGDAACAKIKLQNETKTE